LLIPQEELIETHPALPLGVSSPLLQQRISPMPFLYLHTSLSSHAFVFVYNIVTLSIVRSYQINVMQCGPMTYIYLSLENYAV